jgi:K(+)-stimulated pyrophosphate-energized sodium pump
MLEFGPALAAGGPVDPVTVSGGNLTWVVIVAVVGLLALAVAGGLVREVLAASQGTAKMQEIAKAVQDGAAAYLRRQFRTLGVFVVVIFFILLVLPHDGGAGVLGTEHLLPRRSAVLRADRVHRHVAVRARERPRRGGRP